MERSKMNKLLNQKQAAEILGVSTTFLELEKAQWRAASIPFVRIGNGKRALRYCVETLQNYIETRTVGETFPIQVSETINA
jgi:hypothetical protein